MARARLSDFLLVCLVVLSFFLSLLYSFREGHYTDTYYGLALSDNLFEGYLKMWKGNDPRIGPFWPILLKVSSVLVPPGSGLPQTFPLYFVFALISSLVFFLVYLVSRRAVGKGTALILWAFLLVSGFFPFADKNQCENGIQAFLSLLFVFLLSLAASGRKGGLGPLILLGLVAGIGIQNKIFFLAFLLAVGVAVLVSKTVDFRVLFSGWKRFWLFILGLVAGVFPFLFYNLTVGEFATGRLLLRAFSGGGKISSIGSVIPAILERADNLAVLLRLSPARALLALGFLLAFLLFSLRRSPLETRKAQVFWLVLAPLSLLLSIFSYHQHLGPVHLPALAPLFAPIFGFPVRLLCGRRGRPLSEKLLALLALVLVLSPVALSPVVELTYGRDVLVDRVPGVDLLQRELGFSRAYVQEPYTGGLFSEILGNRVEIVVLGSVEEAGNLVRERTGEDLVFLLAPTGDGFIGTGAVRAEALSAASETGGTVEEFSFPEDFPASTCLRVLPPG